MKVKIINKSGHALPEYASPGSAGVDLRANLAETVTIAPAARALIPTGLQIELPEGFEAQIRSRSGLALKHGVCVLNSPGTIDSDYRGEIKVILINHSDEPYTVNNGDRIAQMVVAKYEKIDFQPVEALSVTERDNGGFGSSGN